MAFLLGIDTGGTYTDAVVVDESLTVLASAKSLTTKENLSLGVSGAMDAALAQVSGEIGLVSLSTTLATNAIVEGQGSPICLLLLGYPRETLERAGLRQVLHGDPTVFIEGGHNAAGSEQAPLDLEVARQAILIHAPKVAAFAVSGYFGVRNPAHELAVRDLVHELTGLPVTCGHQLSSGLDAPRRALTAALNARLIPLLSQLIISVQGMLKERHIQAPLMVVKGDGSLVSAQFALETPVETILSGPAASVVGARHLSGEDDVFVVDMGGTTTDIAVLHQGHPVLNKDGASVGGWRTMVEAVQVHTFGLGGDSEVHLDSKQTFVIGPQRVIPLSLLGMRHPHILEILREQLAEHLPLRHGGQFALRLRPLESAHIVLSYAQAKVWDKLAKGPMAIQDLLTDHTLELPLSRLMGRGLVALSSLTPSDAAHVLGYQQDWSVEAARLGALIWRRQAEATLGKSWENERAFCERIFDQVDLQAGRYLVTTALAERRGEVMQELPAPLREFVDIALGVEEGPGLLGINLSLHRPLIAIGAPVATYYPRVAERLHTRLCIPQHAAVANAYGAVAGGVMQRVTAHITPITEGTFRVHASSGISTFHDLEEAAAHALSETSRLALDQAHRAGAVDVEVKTQREDNVARNELGLDLFIESVVTASAFGRPRMTRG